MLTGLVLVYKVVLCYNGLNYKGLMALARFVGISARLLSTLNPGIAVSRSRYRDAYLQVSLHIGSIPRILR